MTHKLEVVEHGGRRAEDQDGATLDLDWAEIAAGANAPAGPGPAADDAPDASTVEEIVRGALTGDDPPPDPRESAARYELGVAFREQGLVEEAIRELTLAARDQSRSAACSGMLGVCFMEKDSVDEALFWFARALQAAGWPEDEPAAAAAN